MDNAKSADEKCTKSQPADLKEDWSIRPCFLYKDEYNDCTSFKARFHQYFIHGHSLDCSQWKEDYQNCVLYRRSDGNDVEAGSKVIKSEEQRRTIRIRAHYGNDTWRKRSSPPDDWAKPLPEWLLKKNENSFLEFKSKELLSGVSPEENNSYCTIM